MVEALDLEGAQPPAPMKIHSLVSPTLTEWHREDTIELDKSIVEVLYDKG